MLDFNVQQTTASGTINRVVPKRKGDDAGGLTWDIDVVFTIDSASAVSAIDSVMRGAAMLIEQGETDAKNYTLRDGTEWGPGRLWINGAGPLVDGAQADIRFTVLHITGKVAVATTRFRVGGTGSERADLLDNLGEDVDVRFESNQQQFQFEKRKALEEDAIARKQIEVGQVVELVSGNCGVAQSVGEEDVTVVDLDMTRWTAKLATDVAGSFKVTGSTGEGVSPELARYMQRCNRKGKRASWRDIVSALGEAASMGEGPSVDGWIINGDVLDVAIKKASALPKDVPKAADA